MAARRKVPVDDAAAAAAALARHRTLLAALTGLVGTLAERLERDIEADGGDTPPADALDALARAAARLLPLERQALGLDRGGREEGEDAPLDDEERARRIAALLGAVRARRAGRAAGGPAGRLAAAAGTADERL